MRVQIFIEEGSLTTYDFRETHMINYLANQIKGIVSSTSQTLELEVLKISSGWM
jgi:hypothetical protein